MYTNQKAEKAKAESVASFGCPGTTKVSSGLWQAPTPPPPPPPVSSSQSPPASLNQALDGRSGVEVAAEEALNTGAEVELSIHDSKQKGVVVAVNRFRKVCDVKLLLPHQRQRQKSTPPPSSDDQSVPHPIVIADVPLCKVAFAFPTANTKPDQIQYQPPFSTKGTLVRKPSSPSSSFSPIDDASRPTSPSSSTPSMAMAPSASVEGLAPMELGDLVKFAANAPLGLGGKAGRVTKRHNANNTIEVHCRALSPREDTIYEDVPDFLVELVLKRGGPPLTSTSLSSLPRSQSSPQSLISSPSSSSSPAPLHSPTPSLMSRSFTSFCAQWPKSPHLKPHHQSAATAGSIVAPGDVVAVAGRVTTIRGKVTEVYMSSDVISVDVMDLVTGSAIKGVPLDRIIKQSSAGDNEHRGRRGSAGELSSPATKRLARYSSQPRGREFERWLYDVKFGYGPIGITIGDHDNSGVEVKAVKLGSMAASSGVAHGDMIEALNDLPIDPTTNTYKTVAHYIQEVLRPIKITFARWVAPGEYDYADDSNATPRFAKEGGSCTSVRIPRGYSVTFKDRKIGLQVRTFLLSHSEELVIAFLLSVHSSECSY